ncbi:MAG: OmpA family protein [Saprospiraceae bacterium]|nr:OmpA family protein [Saprospiraceae bacterium]
MRIRLLISGLFFVPFMVFAQSVDTSLHIKSIYFGGGNYYIDQEQVEGLYEWLDSFEHIEQYEIIIQSHTDNIGSVQYNSWLSEQRSASVWRQLVNHQILPEAIEIKDFGEILPTYDNSSHLGRLKNRRADVILKPITL